MLDNLLRILTENVDAVGRFSLGTTALIAKWLVTFRVLVDLLFITNKPTFYKILEAKKARKSAGGGGDGSNPAAAAANALGGFASGAANAIKQQGGIDGLLIYFASFLPDIIIQSSYVDAKTGEINENDAATATIATWVGTKAPKIILAAVLLSLVSAGLIVNIEENVAKGVTARSKALANMVNVDGALDGLFGSSDNLLVAENDNTLLGLMKRDAIDKAMNQGIDSKYSYTAENRTAIRNYIEEQVIRELDASTIANLRFTKVAYNPSIMTYAVHAYRRSNATILASTKNSTAQNSNTSTDCYFYFAIVIPQTNGDTILCDDKNYQPVELLIETRAQTSKTEQYFSGSGVTSGGSGDITLPFANGGIMNNNSVSSDVDMSSAVEIKTGAEKSGNSLPNTKIKVNYKGQVPSRYFGDLEETIIQAIEDSGLTIPEAAAIIKAQCTLSSDKKTVTITFESVTTNDEECKKLKGFSASFSLIDDQWEITG